MKHYQKQNNNIRLLNDSLSVIYYVDPSKAIINEKFKLRDSVCILSLNYFRGRGGRAKGIDKVALSYNT